MQSLSRLRLIILLAIAPVAVLCFILVFHLSSPEVEEDVSREESRTAQLGGKTEKEGAKTRSAGVGRQHKETRRKHRTVSPKTPRKRTSEGNATEVIAPSQEQSTPQNLSSLSGKVLDVWSGSGVANAQVSLNRYDPSGAHNEKRSNDTSGTSDGLDKVRTLANGGFLISNIPTGDYKLRIVADGYGEKVRPIWMPPGQQIKGLKFYLETSYTISGRVTDERDNPIPKASVGPIARGERTKTGYDGSYTLEVPQRWNYSLLFKANGYGAIRLYDIPAGSSDVDVVLHPGASISGEVIDGERGLPVANARVNALMQAVKSVRDKVGVTKSDGNGKYTIPDVASGYYLLWAKHRDKTSPIKVVGVKQSEHTRDVNLELLPAGSISGKITEKGTGNRVANITVSAYTNAILYTRAVSKDDGAYRLAGLGPGDYRLGLLTSTHRGINTAEDSPMNWETAIFVPAGRNITDADFIVLGTSYTRDELTEAARISGQLVDEMENGVAGARVSLDSLVPTVLGGATSRQATTLSDEHGTFSFDRVMPKRVWLSAMHPEYENNAIELTLKSGENRRNVKIGLKLRTINVVSGRVTDRAGNPVPGVRVRLWGEGCSASGTTDAEGRYALVGISSGEYDVKAEKEGYKTALIRDITVGREGIKGGVDLQLTPSAGHYIAGVVVDDQEVPISGARITVGDHGGLKTTQTVGGAFRIVGLEDRTYTVIANDWSVTKQQIVMHDIEVDGEDLRIVMKHSTGGISGKVVDTVGQPIKRFGVTYSSRTSKQERSGSVALYSARGEFLIEGLEAGEYQVRIVDIESGNRGRVDGIVVEEGQIAAGVVIEMPDGIRVSGVVVNAAGIPIQGALTCVGGLPEVMGLVSYNERGISNPYIRYTWSGPDGSFQLDNLSNRTRSIGAYHPDYAPGDVNFDGATNTGTVTGLRIVLDQGGDVSGIVRDTTGAPIAGIWVCVQPPFKSATTDANGLFRFEKLAPIKYRFTAARRTSSVWKELSVKEGEEAHIELVLGETDN